MFTVEGLSATIRNISPRSAPASRAISRACSAVKYLASGERISSSVRESSPPSPRSARETSPLAP